MIRSGRHPHEVVILAVFALASIAGVISPKRVSGTVLLNLPAFSLYLFYVVLGVGSLTALVGVSLSGLKGPVVEMYGLAVLSLDLLGYGAAVWLLFGARGTFFGMLTIGIAVGNLWRILQIRRELVAVPKAVRALRASRGRGEV